MNKPTFEAN